MYIKICFLLAVFFVLNTKFVQCEDDKSVSKESRRRLKLQNKEIYEVTDDKLRDYLGYYGNFIPEKDHNWCPKKCDTRIKILISPNLSAYCSCNEKGETVRHQCKKFEIFNSTTSSCTPLLGNGYPTCVLTNKTCPSNKIGIEKHPNTDLYQNYIICMNHGVIVAKCEPNHYYNESQKSCVKLDGRKTILSHSDCHEELDDIKCTVAGVTKLEKYPGFKQKNKCRNCYVICSEKDRNSFDLMIQCSKRKRVLHFLYIQPINDVLKIPEELPPNIPTPTVPLFESNTMKSNPKAVLVVKPIHHSENDENSTEATTIRNLNYSSPETDFDKNITRSPVINNKQIITHENYNESKSPTALEGEKHGTVLKKKKSSTKKVDTTTILEDNLTETGADYNESEKGSNKSEDATASKTLLGSKNDAPGPNLPILSQENLQETIDGDSGKLTVFPSIVKIPSGPILKKLIKKVHPIKHGIKKTSITNDKNRYNETFNSGSDHSKIPKDNLSKTTKDKESDEDITTDTSDELGKKVDNSTENVIESEKDYNKPNSTATNNAAGTDDDSEILESNQNKPKSTEITSDEIETAAGPILIKKPLIKKLIKTVYPNKQNSKKHNYGSHNPTNLEDELSETDVDLNKSDEYTTGSTVSNSKKRNSNKNNKKTFKDIAAGTDDDSEILESNKPKSTKITNDKLVIAALPIFIKTPSIKKIIKKVFPNKKKSKKQNYMSHKPTHLEDELSEIDVDLNKSDKYTTDSPDELIELEKDSSKPKSTVTTDSRETVDSIEDHSAKTIADTSSETSDTQESTEDSPDELSEKEEDSKRQNPSAAIETEPGTDSEEFESNENNPTNLNKKQNIKKNNPKSQILTIDTDRLPETSEENESTISPDEAIAEEDSKRPTATSNESTETGSVPESEIWENKKFVTNSPEESMETEENDSKKLKPTSPESEETSDSGSDHNKIQDNLPKTTKDEETDEDITTDTSDELDDKVENSPDNKTSKDKAHPEDDLSEIDEDLNKSDEYTTDSPDGLLEIEKDSSKPKSNSKKLNSNENNKKTFKDIAAGTDDDSEIHELNEVSHKSKSTEITNDKLVIAALPMFVKTPSIKKIIKKVFPNKKNSKKQKYVSHNPINFEDELSEIDVDLNKSDQNTKGSSDVLTEKEKESNKKKSTVTTDSSETVDSIEDHLPKTKAKKKLKTSDEESTNDSQDKLSDKGEDSTKPKPSAATEIESGPNSEASESNKNNPTHLKKKKKKKKRKKKNPKSNILTTISKDKLPGTSEDNESTTISPDEIIAEDSKQLKPTAATNNLTETGTVTNSENPKSNHKNDSQDPTTIIDSRNGEFAHILPKNKKIKTTPLNTKPGMNMTTPPNVSSNDTPTSIFNKSTKKIKNTRLPVKPPRIITSKIKKIFELVEPDPNHYYEEEHPHDLTVSTERAIKRKRKVITLIKRKLKNISEKPGSDSILNDSIPIPSKITQGGVPFFSIEHPEMDATKNQNKPYTGKNNTNAILDSSQIHDNKSHPLGKKTIFTKRTIKKKNINKGPMNFVLVDLEDVNNETIILEQHEWDEETIAASCRVNIKDQPCPDQGFYRYRGSCSIHYECYYKKECGALVASRLYQCPHCLQFNAKKKRCDSPQHVPECTYHEEDEQNLKGHRLTVPVLACTGPGIFKDPGNPNRYYKCVHIFKDDSDYLTLVKCPRKQIFNDVLKKCVPGGKKQRANRRIIEGGHTNGSYVFDKYSCWRFFHNAGGLLVELHCPDGYIFNGKTCDNTKNSIFCNWEELKKYLYKR